MPVILTPEQEEAIRFVRDETGNMALISYAGSGKTYTIDQMTRSMRERSALCLAFNKSIATEMQERLPSNCTASTLNSMGHQAWGVFLGTRLQLDAKKNQRIIKSVLDMVPEEEIRSWDREITNNLPRIMAMGKTSGFLPSNIPDTNQILDEDEFFDNIDYDLNDAQRWVVVEASRMSWKDALAGVIDFDDQILCPTLHQAASFRSYPITFVDEGQDLSRLNHRMATKIVKDNRFILVGDPNQAIYAFRGAEEDGMAELIDQFDMEIRKLSISFRCDRAIIQNQTKVPDMKWRDDADEGEVRVLKAWHEQDIPDYSAIICRNNAPLLGAFINLLVAGRLPALGNKEVVYSFIRILQSLGSPNMNSEEMLKRIDAWETKTKKTRQGDEAKEDVSDTAQCLQSVAGICATLGGAIDFLQNAVNCKGNIMLSTIHKSKGLEYDTVAILDVELIKPIGQDPNVRYVAETRAKHTLNYIGSAGYTTVLSERDIEQIEEAEVQTQVEDPEPDPDKYPMPPEGWTCFHCGEKFTTYGSARDHFGGRPEDRAACVIRVGEEYGLMMELRRSQDQVRELESEIASLRGAPESLPIASTRHG